MNQNLLRKIGVSVEILKMLRIILNAATAMYRQVSQSGVVITRAAVARVGFL